MNWLADHIDAWSCWLGVAVGASAIGLVWAYAAVTNKRPVPGRIGPSSPLGLHVVRGDVEKSD